MATSINSHIEMVVMKTSMLTIGTHVLRVVVSYVKALTKTELHNIMPHHQSHRPHLPPDPSKLSRMYHQLVLRKLSVTVIN